MTSPNVSKPEIKQGNYDTVHSVGSGFGQNLDENSIRAMLTGRDRAPFDSILSELRKIPEGIVNLALGIPEYLVSSIAWAVGELAKGFGSYETEVPYPQSPRFQDIPEKLRDAVQPLRGMIDEAMGESESARKEAEDINRMMMNAFDAGEDYPADLQLRWNALVNKVDEAQDAAINSLKLTDITQDEAIEALALATMRTGRVVWADRETTVDDGYVRVANPSWNSTAYVTINPKHGWYGSVTAITQYARDHPRIRSAYVANGKMVGKNELEMRSTSTASIEHTIAIYTEMTEEQYNKVMGETTVTRS